MTDVPDRLQAAVAGRYTIQRELGHGGMATVYLAEDLRHHREVALKVLRREIAATLGAARFAREIEVAARLQHPNILPLLDSGEADGVFFYVMPYVEGESLRDRLARTGELPIPEAVRILMEVADALSEAHAHGVVHRDIKPDNVMLRGRHALVTDFGVAKAVTAATGQELLTSTGVALGTPAYMAPEQATADPHQDHRVDIYALGVLGYELLTGRAPFQATTAQEMLAAHLTAEPESPELHRPTVPPALSQIVLKCLAKNPADRFQSADEILPLLEALTTPSGGTTPIVTAPVQTALRARRRLAWTAAAAVLVGALGWVGWRALRPSPLVIEVANTRQVTRDVTPELFPKISPDGREVVYQVGYPGNTDIVVRDVEGGRPIVLTQDWEGVQRLPRWMPDGRDVVFQNQRATADHPVGWWRMPWLGGQATIRDSADAEALEGGMRVEFRVDTVVTHHAGGSVHAERIGVAHSQAWRRDGTAVAFVVGNTDYLGSWGNVAPSEVWVVTEGNGPVRVTDTTSANVSPAWLPDGTLLFVSDRDGPRDIYAVRLDRSGAPRERPVRLTTGLGAYSVSVSADGKTAAYDKFILRRNIYTIPIPRSGSVSIREARALTTDNQTIEVLDLSSDGRWLAFDSNLEGNQDIYVMPAAGGDARQVTRDPGDDFSPDFSPDGREIAFHSTRNATRDIYVINTDGSNERRLTSDSSESYRPVFSPDGLAIAYFNSVSERSIHVLRRDALGAPWRAPERLPIDSGLAPRWSPDGKSIVYDIRTTRTGIGVYRLGGRARTVISAGIDGLTNLSFPEWSADGTQIYFRARGPDNTEGVYVMAVTGGAPRRLVRFDDPAMSVFANAVRAGNGLFYFPIGEIESDVYVMDLVRR